jgi:hypothetical protein
MLDTEREKILQTLENPLSCLASAYIFAVTNEDPSFTQALLREIEVFCEIGERLIERGEIPKEFGDDLCGPDVQHYLNNHPSLSGDLLEMHRLSLSRFLLCSGRVTH